MLPSTDNKDGASRQGELKPEWIRVKDVPKFFGLGRTATYELIAANKIKTVSMRKRGQKHATRLISYDSMRDYLESLATGGES